MHAVDARKVHDTVARTASLSDERAPQPDASAAAHSRRLETVLREAIAAAGGQISFAEYMRLVLYAPGLGYYSAGSRKFGAAGDFVTAPELGPAYARTLARWAVRLPEGFGGAPVLELGAGSGLLAADLLGELARLECLPERYAILEVSADLRERQATTLSARVPDLVDRVVWLDALPVHITGLVIANEVLDAFPVERFRVVADGVEQLVVGWEDGLAGHWRPAPPDLSAAVRAIEADLDQGLGPGFVGELCPMLQPWVGSLCEGLCTGIALLVDYGLSRRELYHPSRAAGTLRCHFRHQAHEDPYRWPGLQDITAWVDFTAIAEAAVAAGAEVLGYTTQAQFLLEAGLGEVVAATADDQAESVHLAQQAKRLLLPGEMGERFKLMALGRGVSAPLPGFTALDMRHRL